jgi:putative DNA methylase
VQEARERVKRTPSQPACPMTAKPSQKVGTGATAYADAVGVYLAFGSTAVHLTLGVNYLRLDHLETKLKTLRNTFARQAIPMTWDFTEVNPFSSSCGIGWVSFGGMGWKKLAALGGSPTSSFQQQADAQVNRFRGQSCFHRPALLRQHWLR